MMEIISRARVNGVPYSQRKVKGNTGSMNKWSNAIIQATQNLSKITRPCSITVQFDLFKGNIPHDFPCGNDIDNLLKRFFDALNETIFSDSPGNDSCIMEVNAKKRIVDKIEEAGAVFSVKLLD
jgi:Holliday junction resolvase RusA-like endonuclease